MTRGRVIRFGEFQLDRTDRRLRHGEREISMRAKSFALLRYLAENPGRLISREELLRAVWPEAVVSPSVVRVSVGEVREALGDDPRQPRYIETVGRQGYRFLGEPSTLAKAPTFVGRESELGHLHRLLERCRARRPQVVFVAGEPGIGKTALVERFVDEVRRAGLATVAKGQCVDLHGSTEPYLPILEMLGRACREDSDGSVHAVLQRWAPTWLLQMPGTIDSSVTELLRRRVPTPTRERMLREFADALEVLANLHPLVLALEDLHWSDASTIDLLTYLAERATPARLLVIGTYRPVDAVVRGCPIRTCVRDLLGRGRAVELTLELLAPQDVETYLTCFFAGVPIHGRLAEAMHRRTDGNPLFLTAITEYLLEHDILAIRNGFWSLGPGGDASIPPSLRELVVREMAALPDDEQRMLEAASVVGTEFDAISVAAATGQSSSEVEARCANLAAHRQIVCAAGTTSWPDGSTGGTYSFLHGLHRDAVYNRLAAAERERLHRAVGERLERAWAQAPASVAAVLAQHFRCASDWSKAVQHHLAAVDASKLRLADREVLLHCEAVMSLLPRLPPSPERDRVEMVCSLELATSLTVTRGYGSPEIRPLVIRARDLARGLELPQIEVLALGGLYMFESMGGDQRRVLELAADMLAMVDRFPLPLVVVMAHGAFGTAHYNLGNLIAARTHLETARAAWRPSIPKIRVDTRVLFLGTGALVLQQLGDTQEADTWISALIEVSHERLDPLNAVSALRAVSTYRHWEGDRQGALDWAERAILVAAEHGLPEYEAMAKIEKGRATDDLSLQREGFSVVQAAGHRLETPAYRLGMAETLIGASRWDEARDELDLALAAAEATGERRHLAEIHRVRAAYLRATDQLEEAVAALHASIAVASQQQSQLFEARARADLAALPAPRPLAGSRAAPTLRGG